jgi:outer membrane immunogenic protein
MKKLLLALTVSLLATTSYAADAVVEKVVVLDEAYNWSGVYIGVQAGYGWVDNEYGYEVNTVDFDSEGFVGGLTVGANWQNAALVFGVEADVSYSDMNGSLVDPLIGAPCTNEGCTADIEWFGTGRARVGYAFDNFLPYITGGFAVGRVEGTADLAACGLTPCFYDDTEWGWTAGLGVEWGVTQQISVKGEYLHVDLGSPDFNNAPGFGAARVDDITFDTVRIGVNYRF